MQVDIPFDEKKCNLTMAHTVWLDHMYIEKKKTERQTLAKDDPTTAASILRPVKRLGTYETILGSIDAYINEISRTPGILGFLGNIGYQGQDAIFGAVYAHKGRTKKTSVSMVCICLHGSAFHKRKRSN